MSAPPETKGVQPESLCSTNSSLHVKCEELPSRPPVAGSAWCMYCAHMCCALEGGPLDLEVILTTVYIPYKPRDPHPYDGKL